MRRVLLAALLGLGLLFGAASVPTPRTEAAPPVATPESPSGPVEITRGIDVADDPVDLPETKIIAPTQPVKRGRQVVFGVEPLKNKPKGLVHYTYVWIISPDPGDEFILDNGSKGSFGSGDSEDPQQYRLTVVSNFLLVDANNAATLLSTKTTTIVNIVDKETKPRPKPTPTPTPTPDPTPGPTPTPAPAPTPTPGPIPAGKYGLGQFMFDQVKDLPKNECQKLALEMNKLAGALAEGAATPSGGIRTKADLVRQSAAAFTTALGSSLKNWKTALDALATKMDSLNIVALPDCQQAYIEVSAGLAANK